MKRVALLLVFIAGWAVPGAFAQDNEHVQVGVFADYFRLSQTNTDLFGVGGRASFRGLQAFEVRRRKWLTTFIARLRRASPTIRPAR